MAFDPAFSFKKHVTNICRSAFYHIRDLRRIRIHLNKATAISLTNALVSSRLDYCDSLLFGCSEKYKTSFQRVQNCLARVVTRSSRLSEYRPLLKSLHWLPIKSRIKFKLNLLKYKALFMGTPLISQWCIAFRETSANYEIRKYEVITSWTAVNKKLRSWLPHRACGINCLLIYVKENQSLYFGKNSTHTLGFLH